MPIEDQQQSRGELTSSHLNPNQEQRNGEERSNREKQSAGTTLAEGFCPLSLSALSPFQTPPCFATFPEILQPRGSQLSQCLLTSSEDTQPICAYPNVAFFSSFYSPSSTPLVSRLHNENHQRSNGRCPVLCPHRSPVVVGASPEELSVHSSGQRGDESRTGITLQHLTGGAFPNAWSALT